jgi:ribosomal-protein-alanine N-acetyltransferase
VSEETLRWRGGWARLSSWRGHDDVAYLTVGAVRPPTAEIVDRCLRALRRQGFGTVVTSALPPADTLPFIDAGFSVRERLHLLMHDMRELPPTSRTTRRARRSDRRRVLKLDHLAFDDFWRLDEPGLMDAIKATPSYRFRVIDNGRLRAYAITGRAERRGYLQRIAVHPDARGEGLGRAVVADALHWLRRHRSMQTLVNTPLDNEPAVALYKSCGFREMPTGLCVMGRDL